VLTRHYGTVANEVQILSKIKPRKETMTLAGRGDGTYTRGKTWSLDFHYRNHGAVRLGNGFNKTVACELAGIKRAQILKGEAGIAQRRTHLPFDNAREDFISWDRANKRPKTIVSILRQATQPFFSAGFQLTMNCYIFILDGAAVANDCRGRPC
jgi:hypothetical protein